MGLFDFIEDEGARKKAEEAHTANLTTVIEETVSKQVAEEVSGLKSKNVELLAEKKKIAETLKNFDNLDADKAREALKFLEENENARLLKEGKIDELLAKQTSQLKEDHEAEVGELKAQLGTEKTSAGQYKQMFERKVVEDTIRSAAIKAGVRSEALDDVLIHGNIVFSLAEDKTVEARDSEGKLLKIGDDLVLTPDNWLESLKSKSPHYWPDSEGAGGTGSTTGGAYSDLTEAMNAAAKKGNMVLYRKLRAKQKKLGTP